MMEIVKIETKLIDLPSREQRGFVALYANEKGDMSYQYEYVGQVWKTEKGIGIAFDGKSGDWLYFTDEQYVEFYNKVTALEYRPLESTTKMEES